MTKLTSLIASGVLVLGAGLVQAGGPGDEVVVVYNSRLPESKSVAAHYAKCRQVPSNQMFGFDLPTDETISRSVFRDQLEKPLARAIEKAKLWQIRSQVVLATNGGRDRVEWRVIESNFRYLVLCYGVPLRIAPDEKLVEPGDDKVRPEMRRNEAAVDSELACLPHIEQRLPLFGPLRNPLYTVTNASMLHPTNGVLMVTRLDGPTADIAKGLVDKALEAERNGLWGRAYFDARGITDGGYAVGDDWMQAAAGICRIYGFETIVDTNGATFSASFPMDHIALYAGWYDANVSGPFTRPTVEFVPGAFAYHLHSFSADTVRAADRNWVGPLLAKGATATMGSVYEPYLTGTPDIGGFFARFLIYAFTFGEAAYACQETLSWQTTVVGDPLYRPFGQNPQSLHLALERRGSPLVAWSHLRVANLTFVQRQPLMVGANYLEQTPATTNSAVLEEKLGDLYAALGKPASSVLACQKALELKPSPQQRIRLLLTLAERLVAQQRDEEALDVYRQFLSEYPDYPDRLGILQKALPLAQKLKSSEADKLQAEITRLTPAPPPPATNTPAANSSPPKP